jgi:hypothetical protein
VYLLKSRQRHYITNKYIIYMQCICQNQGTSNTLPTNILFTCSVFVKTKATAIHYQQMYYLYGMYLLKSKHSNALPTNILFICSVFVKIKAPAIHYQQMYYLYAVYLLKSMHQQYTTNKYIIYMQCIC